MTGQDCLADAASKIAVAKAFSRLFASGDVDAFCALFTDDALIWHNHDCATHDREQTRATMLAFWSNFAAAEYVETRRTVTESGIVQQSIMRGMLKNGKTVDIPSCLVMEVRDGQVARLDEYIDPAPFYHMLSAA